MNRYFILICMAICTVALFAEGIGTISFVLGTVEYRPNQNSTFVSATRNMSVSLDGFIRTDLGAKAEIIFTGGALGKVEANKVISIRQLYEEASAAGAWSSKVKRQLKNLSLPSSKEASTVAGIRRSEAVVKETSDYFWAVPELASFSDAMMKYESGKLSEAIPVLQKVIAQDPLTRDAELSHLLLGLIHEELNNPAERDKHLNTLKMDFPHSQFLPDLPAQ
ncbi:MAG TPA: hypothetical protein PLO57_01635 [Candidatus Cloacimonadota bacterium]|nr:hypothetical protein [Candidatus Cloacimonadota bacterium]